MSDIVEALKGEEKDFWISNDERIALCEMLACVAAALRTGKLWLNSPKAKCNEDYAALAETIARRFANMPVEKEQ
jgi:hypothetical protein